MPITTAQRLWPNDVTTDRGHAQCHLVTTVDHAQVVERTGDNVGAVLLAQIREIVSVLLGV